MPRPSTLKAPTPTSPRSAASALAAFRQELMDRLPIFISAGYRNAIRDIMQANVDVPNLNCRLRWIVEAAYHNNTEPMPHEVVTLGLFFDSGALEGYPLCVRRRFYAKNPALACHMHDCSLQGLVGNHDAKVRAGGIQAPTVVFRDGRDDEHTASLATLGYGVVNHAKAAARCEKRPASDVDNLSPPTRRSPPNAAASIPGNPSSSHVSPIPVGPASPFSLGIQDTRNAPVPANILGSSSENPGTVAERVSNARLASLDARIAEHHQQTHDKLRQAAALREEHAKMAVRQPLRDDGAGIRDLAAYVAESHGLAARAIQQQEEAVISAVELSRLESERADEGLKALSQRVVFVQGVAVLTARNLRRERRMLASDSAQRLAPATAVKVEREQ
ncbi:hypothetical protein CTA2_10311 [Colletotrichum tanaceti]|uniref:Uncharacterized protein n=1 Tax=Colletotrichum tanaceti TaxID=1306861 RepID=A0A4U6X554_9PEZI|nr:hypothetical protein CTA2_10311 [Colletotrichum tanaceti]TKW50083.1 hypothetical protein CTA1_4355 [Colletotrichum tanaceti]